MSVVRAKRLDLFSYQDLNEQQIENSEKNNKEIKNKANKLNSYPKRLVLELTNACNLKCVMCGRDESEFNQTFFDINLLKKFEEILASIEEVTLFGWGEPTMHPKFRDLLQFFDKYPVKKYFVTNGMFLDKFADDIFENKVDIIAVSLDGAKSNTNNDIRLKSDFDKIKNNIDKLVAMKSQRGLSYPYINFVMTLMKGNIKELPEMVYLAKELGVDEVKAVYLTAFSHEMSIKTLWEQKDRVREIFDETIALGKKYNIKVKLPHIQGEDPAGNHSHKNCYVPWRDFFIGSDGFVRSCQSTSHKLFHHEAYESFNDMWNSSEYQDFRNRVNNEEQMNDECRRCYQSSHANWNKKQSFIQCGEEFAPNWVRIKK
ncbi:MAG: radical SAM protein [Gammaproteobacteria bacterium]|nr:radical SAM protein [Gammaproteobacteria bacterium]